MTVLFVSYMIEKNANFQKMLSEKHYPWKRIKKREIWRDWYCNGPTTYERRCTKWMQYQVFGVPLIIIYVFDEENITRFLRWTFSLCWIPLHFFCLIQNTRKFSPFLKQQFYFLVIMKTKQVFKCGIAKCR